MQRENVGKLLKPILAVKDRALDQYNLPFTQTTVAQAVRGFTDEINRADSALAAHPDDYDLYLLGYYDEELGRLQSLDNPDLVVRGKDLVRPKSNGPMYQE